MSVSEANKFAVTHRTITFYLEAKDGITKEVIERVRQYLELLEQDLDERGQEPTP